MTRPRQACPLPPSACLTSIRNSGYRVGFSSLSASNPLSKIGMLEPCVRFDEGSCDLVLCTLGTEPSLETSSGQMSARQPPPPHGLRAPYAKGVNGQAVARGSGASRHRHFSNTLYDSVRLANSSLTTGQSKFTRILPHVLASRDNRRNPPDVEHSRVVAGVIRLHWIRHFHMRADTDSVWRVCPHIDRHRQAALQLVRSQSVCLVQRSGHAAGCVFRLCLPLLLALSIARI